MGLFTETVQALTLTLQRRDISGLEGPLPLTAARVVEWLSGPPTSSGVRVTPQSSLQIAAVYSCVRVKSEDVASLPFIMYRRLERGKERATDHPIYWLLQDSPNPRMSSMTFRETLQGHLETWGNAYANVERDSDGRVVALWPLRPDCMIAVEVSQAGRLLYTYQLPNGEPTKLTQDEVLHLRGMAHDGIMGYSPVQLHRETLGLSQSTLQYGARFFANDARPGGYLQSEKPLTTEAAERLRKTFEAAHKGMDNAWRLAVLEDGVTWQQAGMPNEDAEFLSTRKFTRSEIAGIWRVPPHKIGDLERATFTNIEEQDMDYAKSTLRPALRRWEQEIARALFTEAERRVYVVEHLMEDVLKARTSERFAAYGVAITNGWMTRNEVRERENLNPLPELDEPLQPLNMVPAGTEPEPEPAAAPAAARRVVRMLRRTEDGYEVTEQDVEVIADAE